MVKNTKDTDGLFDRRVAKVLPSVRGLKNLASKRKIRVYLGVDPTGSRLHLGHAIGLKKLMDFAKAGHEAILLFGTGTVLVGDPSLRDKGREAINPQKVGENIRDWKKQAGTIIDFSRVKTKQNADWLEKLKLKDIIDIASKVSAVQLFKRDSFRRRLGRGDTVWYHETMYPLLQGYDSVEMDVDLEIGGTDQEFNMLMGREIMKKMTGKEKYVITTPMIMGTNGKTMSKTSGNCVWLDDTTYEMYGKLMALQDKLIGEYLEYCTDIDDAELAELKASLKTSKNPRDIKARMAYEVTRIYHGDRVAKQAAADFDAQFKERKLPANIPSVSLSKRDWDAVELLVETNLSSSRSTARRLLEQGGARLNSNPLTFGDVTVQRGDVLQAGKRKFVKIG